MKNKIFSIIGIIFGITAVIGISLTALSNPTYSEQKSEFEDRCSTGKGEDRVTDQCCITYNKAIAITGMAWEKNMENMMGQEKMGQEKAASTMVDEAYENLRSYECLLGYICRAVKFSGYRPIDTLAGAAQIENTDFRYNLTSADIGVIEGCQKPEDLGMPTLWDTFGSFLQSDWDLFMNTIDGGGSEALNVIVPVGIFQANKIPFLPQCMTNFGNKNLSDSDFITAIGNFDSCMEVVNKKFGCKNNKGAISHCTSESIAFVKLETNLRKKQADQKAMVLEKKLSSIITKMLQMEEHVEIVKTRLQQLDDRFSCYIEECS